MALELRCTSILGWASTLAVLMLLGARLRRETPSDWRRVLEALAMLDWRKDAVIWNAVTDMEGRPFKGNQATEWIYRLLRTACVSARESPEGTQPTLSATSLVSLRNRGTLA
jgi:hypothetical protein